MTRWWVRFEQRCRAEIPGDTVRVIGQRLRGDVRVTDVAVDRAGRLVGLSGVVQADDALEALRLVRPVFGSALGYAGVPWSGDGERWGADQLEALGVVCGAEGCEDGCSEAGRS